LLAVAPLLLAVAGCGATLDAQTYAPRTAVDSTNATINDIAIRNLRIEPPAGGITLTQGDDAPVSLVVTNTGGEPDQLLSVESPAAQDVALLTGGRPGEFEVPAGGSTQGESSLLLQSLTADLLTGEYVPMTLRFERAGDIEVLVPVATSGRVTRDVFTGEPDSEEGEPALGGPAGGHGSEDEPE